jgi:Membrane bound O-acyl transferase family
MANLVVASLNYFILLSKKFSRDDREPSTWWEFSMIHPWIARRIVGGEAVLDRDSAVDFIQAGVVGSDARFWGIMFALLLFQTVFNIFVSLVLYFGIVKQQQLGKDGRDAAGIEKNRFYTPVTSYLLAFGVICPFLLYWPVLVISHCQVQNAGFVLPLVATTPAILFFRCLEVVHGTYPLYVANKGLLPFLLYCATPMPFKYDESKGVPVRLSFDSAVKRAIRVHVVLLQTSLFFSILIPCNYQLFPRRDIGSLSDLFYWGNIANGYVLASLTSLILESSAAGLGLLFSLVTGYETLYVHDSPITQSSSPSDFWGRRWNLYVSQTLRRGVYLPLRVSWGASPAMSIVGTFVASGLLHEYILVCLRLAGSFLPVQHYGQLVFFAWCGIVIILEHWAVRSHVYQMIQPKLQRVPRAVRTFLVLMTVLPLAHLFTDEYLHVYSDLAIGYPRIIFRAQSRVLGH